ncbi:MAG: TPM domain-containing protein [Nitrospinota bacterium]
MFRRFLLFGVLFSVGLSLAWVMPALSLEVPPPPRTRVTDATGTLSPEQSASLERLLADFESKTSNQVVVLMIPTLGGDSLEDFSIRVADRWKPGQKGKDNGAILLVVKNDRKMRIEVGYGLEGALPDALAMTIVRNEIAPRFRGGDFYGGLRAGVQAIMAATKGEYKATPRARRRREEGVSLGAFWPILLFFLFGGLFGGFRRRRLGYWGLGPAIFLGMSHGGATSGRSSLGGGGFGGFGGFSGGGGGFGGGGASGGW